MKTHFLFAFTLVVFIGLGSNAAYCWEDGEIAASELVKGITYGTACNGGAVTAPGGLVITCPTSGGPRCSTDQECHCAAMLNPHGGYDSENICKKKP